MLLGEPPMGVWRPRVRASSGRGQSGFELRAGGYRTAIASHPESRAEPQSNVILDASQAMITRLLSQHGFRLAESVCARFHESHGSTGVAITIRLAEPDRAPAAREVIAERFGRLRGVDVLDVR
jgi:hypothetical protein